MTADRLSAALRTPRHARGALVAYVVAGFPSREVFPDVLAQVATVADAIEVGVPFTDPMADGVSIQRASQVALAAGVDLPWILEVVAGCPAPVALMGYLNPFLAHGPRLAGDLGAAGVSAVIVPDLPLEEQAILGGVPQVQLVTPLTPEARIPQLCAATSGFLYVVTMTGTTGGEANVNAVPTLLTRVRAQANHPVMAGFGIRTPEQVASLEGVTDGVIVGSALVEVLRRGEDPGAFLTHLMTG